MNDFEQSSSTLVFTFGSISSAASPMALMRSSSWSLASSSQPEIRESARDTAAPGDDKYPPPRRGEGDCGDVEWEFKKCVAFAVDERNARILYGDGEGGKKFKREEKYEANRILVEKIRAVIW